jgi:hypothetical protein
MEVCFFPEHDSDFVFREGQYLYLLAPHLSDNEWHPFTISSAHGDLEMEKEVTCHIRVQGDKSWTRELMEYFAMMTHSKMKAKGACSAGARTDGPRRLTGPSRRRVPARAGALRQQRRAPGGQVPGPRRAAAAVGGRPARRAGAALQRVQGSDDRGRGHRAHPLERHPEIRVPPQVEEGLAVRLRRGRAARLTPGRGRSPQTIYFYWVVRHEEIESFRWFIRVMVELEKRVASDRYSGVRGGRRPACRR